METKTENVFIIPGSIYSHIIPSFFIANRLRDNCTVHYLVETEGMAKLAAAQGFSAILLKAAGIGYSADYHYVNRKYSKSNKVVKGLLMAYLYITNRLYKRRRAEIDTLLKRYQPRAVFIDVFNIPNYIFFNRCTAVCSISLFSPMMSVCKINGVPGISENSWEPAPVKNGIFEINPWKMGISGLLDYWAMLRCCRSAGLPRKNRLLLRPFTTYYFDNVPEMVLGPSELELTAAVQQPNQYYLGLCTTGNRTDTRANTAFDMVSFRQMKQQGKKILYCAFGTFFHAYEHHIAVTRFITNVIEAYADEQGIELIIASNTKVLEVLQTTLPQFGNVHLFAHVPQLLILEELADVFITHGGLGSVKEAIEFGVPMLVYPVDLRWDQRGNGLKVATHGLGLQGELRRETTEGITEKAERLLREPHWKAAVAGFAQRIKAHYNPCYLQQVFAAVLKGEQQPAA